VSYTQEQADSLRAAIARGVRKVQMNGEMVEYQSLAEMEALLARMQRSLSPAESQAASQASRRHYPNVTRGT
jgi:hypothetical protein